jgi:hypothetical protein
MIFFGPKIGIGAHGVPFLDFLWFEYCFEAAFTRFFWIREIFFLSSFMGKVS